MQKWYILFNRNKMQKWYILFNRNKMQKWYILFNRNTLKIDNLRIYKHRFLSFRSKFNQPT
jgi:hypothetical protein